jgi:hypothetical protein
MTSLPPKTPDSEILLYQTEDGHTRIEVQFKGDTAWLSLNQIAELFDRDKSLQNALAAHGKTAAEINSHR